MWEVGDYSEVSFTAVVMFPIIFSVLSASLACFIQCADTLLSSGMFGIRHWSTRMWVKCIFGCVGAGLQPVVWVSD